MIILYTSECINKRDYLLDKKKNTEFTTKKHKIFHNTY